MRWKCLALEHKWQLPEQRCEGRRNQRWSYFFSMNWERECEDEARMCKLKNDSLLTFPCWEWSVRRKINKGINGITFFHPFSSFLLFFSTPAHECIVNSRCIVMLNLKKMDLNCSAQLLKRNGVMYESQLHLYTLSITILKRDEKMRWDFLPVSFALLQPTLTS